MRSAIRITFLYFLFAGLWILLSDRVLETFVRDAHELSSLQTHKGVFFVVASSALLFFFVIREMRRRERAELDRRTAEREIQSQLEKSRSLHESAQAFSRNLDFNDLSVDIVRRCVADLGANVAWLCHRSAEGRLRLVKTWPEELPFKSWVCSDCRRPEMGDSWICRRTRDTASCVIDDLAAYPEAPEWKEQALQHGLRSVAFFPLHSHEDALGTLMVGSRETGYFTVERVDFLEAYAHQAAIALESACLFTEKVVRVERLKALRTIDSAIASTFDLRSVLRVVLDQALSQLGVDAADVLLLHRDSRILEFVEGAGFNTQGSKGARVHLDADLAGRAARDLIPVIRTVDDLSPDTEFGAMIAAEGFKTYVAVPLVAKDEVEGVLEVFTRIPLHPEAEWLDFLQTLAGQAAIAIENALLFTNLEMTNEELTHAYDRTLEGWSHALELRDIETHGHTQRVMNATFRLARIMGMTEEELVHLRRGALLHDIGKLAIPDRILLKAGPLTDGEWEIMCLHPLYAYELLSPIPFLRAALDIPFCHHEWWDGTGYPRGLRGEEIPLASRIFTVVDVVDALRSNRPYCDRWPKESILDHIREHAGKHFDPRVVSIFLQHADEILPALDTQPTGSRSGSSRQEWRYQVEVDVDSADDDTDQFHHRQPAMGTRPDSPPPSSTEDSSPSTPATSSAAFTTSKRG